MDTPERAKTPSDNFPKLYNPPPEVQIENVLSAGTTASSDIYVGKNPQGKKVVFDIARNPSLIEHVRAKYNFLVGEIPTPKRNLGNLFRKFEPQLIQDFHVTKKVANYGVAGMYGNYEITTRFVRLDKESISPEMLNNGQIVEEYVEGLPLESKDLPFSVKQAAIASYLDFSLQLFQKTHEILDVNIETDLLVSVNEANQNIVVVRVDTSPWQLSEELAVKFLSQSIARLTDKSKIEASTLKLLFDRFIDSLQQ